MSIVLFPQTLPDWTDLEKSLIEAARVAIESRSGVNVETVYYKNDDGVAMVSIVPVNTTENAWYTFWKQGGYIYCSNIHNTVTVGSSLKVHLANLFFGPGGEVKRVPLVSSVEWSDKPLDTSKAVETASFAPTRKGVTS